MITKTEQEMLDMGYFALEEYLSELATQASDRTVNLQLFREIIDEIKSVLDMLERLE